MIDSKTDDERTMPLHEGGGFAGAEPLKPRPRLTMFYAAMTHPPHSGGCIGGKEIYYNGVAPRRLPIENKSVLF